MAAPKLNLDDLRPPDVLITFNGIEYAIPGDLPLMTLIEASDLQDGLENANTLKEQADVLRKMYRLAMDLFRQRNADVPDLGLSAREVGFIVGFLASGGDVKDLPDAIVAALAPDDGEGAEEDGGRPPTKPKAPARRSPRTKPSPKTSSG